MGIAISLTNEEEKLRDRIKYILEILLNIYDYPEYKCKTQDLYMEMADKAHQLHMSLKNNGHEPKHHKYMIENRGVATEDVEFYNHIHPVEDLLAFIENENANDDPEDTTIGKEFKLKVYTRRWGHYDYYIVVRTATGWNITTGLISNSGDCDKSCEPHLSNALKHDNVCYPKQLGIFMEFLWDEANDGLDEQGVQVGLDQIGNWISSTERNTPTGIFSVLI